MEKLSAHNGSVEGHCQYHDVKGKKSASVMDLLELIHIKFQEKKLVQQKKQPLMSGIGCGNGSF